MHRVARFIKYLTDNIQVGDGYADHAQWGRVEQMTIARPSYKVDAQKPGSDLAGEISASLTSASLAFATADPAYSATLLEHAKQLFNFADKYRNGCSSQSQINNAN